MGKTTKMAYQILQFRLLNPDPQNHNFSTPKFVTSVGLQSRQNINEFNITRKEERKEDI
jgi:hypothetical protein